ncbi:zinc-dependent alcohol dehydrogenase family protein [Pedococcus sp. NPDC057267]|uniref:zinc-dependent alcohol dehydrogenase family protein n=1 Tax=Pedococcus sp. NPDC057267 TaxID=3346077 RepID=UPI003624CE1E
MRAWEVTGRGGAPGRLRLVDRPVPEPAPGEVLVRVEACGVCRTDLHVADGDLAPHRPRVVPGHEVVGTVVRPGSGGRFRAGDRVGVAWLRHTCGECRWCRSGTENLCPRAEFTGWDHDGGYAEYVVAAAAFAYRVPDSLPAEQAAPLLCAGIIGYRALRRAALPPGGRLGLYGFGASAHLTAQVALAQGAEVHVLTRGARARLMALELGAASAGDAYDEPPVPLDAAIVFAPVGDLVPVALEALDRGGSLVLAGIHLSDVPVLDYQRHLFLEKRLTTVTANTRADGEELLRLAGRLQVRAQVTSYPFEQADAALDDLATGRVTGVAVLAGWSDA